MRPAQLAAGGGLVLWAGATLVLAGARWFARRPLTERLRPYHPGALDASGRPGGLSAESLREVVGPLARRYGDALGRLVGQGDDLQRRLTRAASPLDPTSFRVRQLGWSLVALLAGLVLVAGISPPAVVGMVLALGPPLLAALLLEQQVDAASLRYQRRLFDELPVLAEQLGMLLSSGYSLGSGVQRLADRGRGVAAPDLARVCNRVRHGLTVTAALREWADVADLDELHRLVQVLELHRTAADLGPLIAEEARSIRREAHRRTLSSIERRAEMVWIPVTVAALLPGALFLIVPFADAMRLFTS
jgi:tight adherence protein C